MMWRREAAQMEYRGGSLHSHSTNRVYQLAITWVLLIPLLFLLVKGGFSFERVQSNNTMDHNASLLVDTRADAWRYRSEQLVIYAVVLMIVFSLSDAIKRRLFAKDNILLLALPLWAVLSAIWSQDPLRSFVSAIFIWLVLFLGAYLSVRFSQERQLSLLFVVGWVGALTSLGMVLFDPAAGIEHFDAKGSRGKASSRISSTAG